MADEFFSAELPDIQGFIKTLDLMDEKINKAVRDGLHKGADIILAEQKGNVYVTKKGVLGVAVGYLSDAFIPDENNINHGVIGSVYEFGRPGQSPQRSGDTMTQKRHGKLYTVKKGAIQPQPHIRRGFDNVVEQAAQAVIDSISAELDKFGD